MPDRVRGPSRHKLRIERSYISPDSIFRRSVDISENLSPERAQCLETCPRANHSSVRDHERAHRWYRILLWFELTHWRGERCYAGACETASTDETRHVRDVAREDAIWRSRDRCGRVPDARAGPCDDL